jgi:MoxR-like ATPase
MTEPTEPATGPDRRDGRVYLTSEVMDLAADVAHATGRPLLLRGDPGSGKSSFAAWFALKKTWRYYEHVVTARTQTQDLLWSFDVVRRFADAPRSAAAGKPMNEHRYVTPGALWWVFNRESAARRGAATVPPEDHAPEPLAALNADRDDGAVILIDEIDKADPDVPNGLLVPLGSREFLVSETGTLVRSTPQNTKNSLVVITTNDERELPAAFLRRCIVLTLAAPSPDRLCEIAAEHLSVYQVAHEHPDPVGLARALADELEKVRTESGRHGHRAPSTAEYLDALYACLRLGITVDDDRWAALSQMTLRKADHYELS